MMKPNLRERVEDYLSHGSSPGELREICERWCAVKPKVGYP